MIKSVYVCTALLFLLAFSSCLKQGLEDLPSYEGAEITSVSLVEYRYVSSDTSPATGQPMVKFVTLVHSSSINSDNGEVEINVEIPPAFPAEELANLSAANLVVAIGLSTAAIATPSGNSARFGAPGDWSGTNTYVVKAANGTTKDWRVTLTLQLNPGV